MKKIIFSFLFAFIFNICQAQPPFDGTPSAGSDVPTKKYIVYIYWGGANPIDSKPLMVFTDSTLLEIMYNNIKFDSLKGKNDGLASKFLAIDPITGKLLVIRQDSIKPSAQSIQQGLGYIPYNGTANPNSYLTTSGAGSIYQTLNNLQGNLLASSVKYPSVDAVNTGLSAKQDVLVSGTTIKTIGGVSILGSGNIPVGSGTVTSVTSANGNATITNTTTTINIPIVTLLSLPSGDADIPVVEYTTSNTNDVIELWGSVAAGISVGNLRVNEAAITAVRIYK